MKTKISIQNPCDERTINHQSIIGGQYCAQCTKIVKDFRSMSDQEILHYFKNYRGEICGTFNTDQTDRKLKTSQPANLSFLRKGIAASAIGGVLALGSASAQSNPPTQIEISGNQLNKNIAKNPKQNPVSRTIQGTIIEKNGEPLIGANVVLQGTHVGTTTDFDGKYQLTIPSQVKGDSILVSYVGFESKEFPISSASNQQINVSLDSGVELTEVVVIGYGANVLKGGACLTGGVTSNGIEISENQKPEEQPQNKSADEIYIEKIFPNPFFDDFKVNILSDKQEKMHFRLFAMDGQLIWNTEKLIRKGNNVMHVRVSQEIPAGTYVLHAHSEYRQFSQNIMKVE